MEKRIKELLTRFSELEALLSNPDILSDQKKYKALAQEHAHLSELKSVLEEKERVDRALNEHKELLSSEKEEEILNLLKEEVARLEEKSLSLKGKVENLLVPPDPNDSRSVILELRAGTGGEEAALFVADCVRMYELFATRMGWKHELLSCSPSDLGGFKEYIMVLSGTNVKRFLQYEGGTHRVQRVPETEGSGRIHTSAITIATIIEPGEEEEVRIEEKDLKIDTFRASGAGGQHVNVTDSAVRITHIPTGIVVACQEERSQHKNRDKAMRLLKAKIADVKRQKREAETARQRASQVGSGDRSERIRTYNFPQNRLTDHRIHLTIYNLKGVMDGALETITGALVSHFYQEELQGE